MADNTHLKRIRQTWYVQVAVPRKLQSIVGKQVFLRSTGTRDVTEARRRRHAIVARFLKIIDAARRTQATHETGPVGDLLNEAALMRRQIQAGLLTRDEVLGTADYDPATGELTDTPGIWELMLERLERLEERANFITPTQAKAIRAAGSQLKDPKVHLADAIDAYLGNNPNLRPSTIHTRRTRLDAFLRWVGDKPVDAISRADGGRYVSEVLQQRGLTASTIRQTIGDLSSFFRFCIVRGLSSISNPFEGTASSIRDNTRGTAEKANGKQRAWSDGDAYSGEDEHRFRTNVNT